MILPISRQSTPDTWWESARFHLCYVNPVSPRWAHALTGCRQAVSWLKVCSVKAASARPTHQRVTQAVGQTRLEGVNYAKTNSIEAISWSGEELEGCAEIYLKSIAAIIALALVMGFCGAAIDNIDVLVPFLIKTSIFFLVVIAVVKAVENRSQIAPWLVRIENQIEQWTKEQLILVVTSLIALSFFLIILLAVLGLTKGR